jgi:hypothetical protein
MKTEWKNMEPLEGQPLNAIHADYEIVAGNLRAVVLRDDFGGVVRFSIPGYGEMSCCVPKVSAHANTPTTSAP